MLLQTPHKRLRPLHERHALVYVRGRSGPTDQSNGSLAVRGDHSARLSGSSQDLRMSRIQYRSLRARDRTLRPDLGKKKSLVFSIKVQQIRRWYGRAKNHLECTNRLRDSRWKLCRRAFPRIGGYLEASRWQPYQQRWWWSMIYSYTRRLGGDWRK